MSKKKKILIAAAVLIAALAIVYKMPKSLDDILPYPFDFENAAGYSCFAITPEKQRAYFPPDEGNASYEEIYALLSEAEFISDFRNIVPVDFGFPKYTVEGSHISIEHEGKSCSIEFYSGDIETGHRCTVTFYDDGVVSVKTNEYHEVIWSYKLKDASYFEKIWEYIFENGSVY
ncbi:MAG: hypothetical protein IJE83_06270 [Oscillospiraceae bacterium]|nr:hypothetical protein [Oscillospiraceae bacterium]MBQ2862380.1 hypothetical protein [Oscillospiraceae bacterium]MBQ2998647.1 hypothetical protein [Oscillospiraceae bacterium]MBQ6701268.1 hypothetical protein [Oscillospiraceae bacterium]